MKQATLRWVRSTVIGLHLCPWASGALSGGRLRLVTHPERDGMERTGEITIL